jgi:hypothetical protein
MKKPTKVVLESIASIKNGGASKNDFDNLYSWLVDCLNDADAVALETPRAENVFTHWVSLGNLQVLRTIVDTFDEVEDRIMRIKLGGFR